MMSVDIILGLIILGLIILGLIILGLIILGLIILGLIQLLGIIQWNLSLYYGHNMVVLIN